LPGPPLFVGNKAFSDVRLAKQSRLRKGSDLTIEELEAESSNLEAFYLNHGYPNARVSCRSFGGGATKPDDFIFVIEEGSKVE
jgi:outer membrane protein insertion porin family